MTEAEERGEARILLTGATGFIGAHICEALLEKFPDKTPLLALRSPCSTSVPCKVLGDFTQNTDWSDALKDVETVIHCAGRAHILNDTSDNPEMLFRESNTLATLNLAQQAHSQGVNRFIFLSSIGVNGNASSSPFTPDDDPAPADPYTQSKLEAERGLWRLQQETSMEVVIIRPPLAYGPEAPGNFGLLAKVLRTGLPLPLSGIENARSFVSVWNLADLVTTCVDHPQAANQTFLVRDGEDVSTSELLRKMAIAQGQTPKLFWLPSTLLKAGATLVGKRQMYDRLFDSLQVDDTATRETLDWEPPLSLDEGIKRSFSTE